MYYKCHYCCLQLLELDIANHQEKVTDVSDAAQEFKEAKHFMNKELQARAKEVQDRYASLDEPCTIRRDNLNEALLMYQFYRDVEDELSWIHDKKPLADSTDLGNTLSGVQNLIKKHQALESEIVAHEPLIDTVASAAQQMIKSKHFASAEIEKRLEELHVELQQLKEVSSVRRVKLQDALESQKVSGKLYVCHVCICLSFLCMFITFVRSLSCYVFIIYTSFSSWFIG